LSNPFFMFMNEYAIKYELIATYIPQKNVVLKKENRTIIQVVYSCLYSAHIFLKS
jgi:hypothetical protein